MIETFNIILILFLNLVIFCSPIFFIHNNNFKNIEDIVKIKICFNIIFYLNIFLILSFIKINFTYLLLSILFINILQIIIFLRNFSLNKNIKFFYLILFFTSIILSINLSVNLRLEWDASVNWIFKALNFYDGFTFNNLDNIPGIVAYPHLGSYIWAFFWKISFFNAEYFGRLFFLFLFVYTIILNSYRGDKNLVQNIIVLILITTLFYDQNSFAGYQEGMMFSLIGIIFFLINKIEEYRKINYLNFFFIFSAINLLLWIKNEGVVWSILIISYIFLIIKKQYKYKIILSVGFIILSTLKYFIFYKVFGENIIGWKGYTFISLDVNFLITIIERLPFIMFGILKVFFKYSFLIITIIILSLNFFKKKGYMQLLFFLLVNLISVGLIFILTTEENWKFYVDVGFDRMIYQTSSFYIFIISNFLHNNLTFLFGGNGKN